MVWQTRQDVDEPGLRIDVVQLPGFYQRVDRSGTAATFVRAREGLVAAADSDSTHRAFGGIIAETDSSVIQEAHEGCPTAETVINGLRCVILRGEPRTLLVQPSLKSIDERLRLITTDGDAPSRRFCP